MLSFNVELLLLSNAAFSSSGGSTTGRDITPYTGNLFLLVSDRAGGTAAATVTVEHSTDLSTNYSTVPANALFNVNTGADATFADLSTSASTQVLGLNRQQLKKYIRVTIAGTGITHNLAIVLAVQPQMTEETA